MPQQSARKLSRPSKINYNDPEVKEKFEKACEELSEQRKRGISPKLRATARKYNLPHTTLRNRYLCLHKPKREAHEDQKLLDEHQEGEICAWVQFKGMIGEPLDAIDLRKEALDLSGKFPGKNWVKRFLARHLEGDIDAVMDAESRQEESDDDIDLEDNTGDDGNGQDAGDDTHYLITGDMGTRTQVSSTSAMLSTHAPPTSNGTPGDYTPGPVDVMTAPTPLPETPAVNSAESNVTTVPPVPDAQSQNVAGDDSITRPNSTQPSLTSSIRGLNTGSFSASSSSSLALSSIGHSGSDSADHVPAKEVRRRMGCIAAAIHDQDADHPAAIKDALDLVEILLGDRTRYKARSIIMANQLAHTTRQKYARETQLQRRNCSVHVDHGEILTSSEALARRAAQDAKKAENKRIEEERARRRDAKKAERQAQRLRNEPFSGSLSSKNKNDLEDIALALGVPFTDKTLKADIRKAIQDHFEAHPELKEDPQFSGLFRRSNRSVQGPIPSEASSSSSNHMLHAPGNAVATTVTPSPYYSPPVPQLNGNLQGYFHNPIYSNSAYNTFYFTIPQNM